MRIVAYSTQSENNKVEKVFTFKASFDGTLRKPCSIKNPIIDIEYAGIPNSWTHLYIVDFNRWYFIDDIISVNTNLIEIKASVDVLESFHGSRDDETGLYALSGYVSRNEFSDNYRITDNTYPVYCNPLITRYNASVVAGSWQPSSNYLRDTVGNNRYFLRMQGQTKANTSTVGTFTPLATVVCDCNGFADLVALIRDRNEVSATKPITEYIYNMGCLPCNIPHHSTRITSITLPGLLAQPLVLPTDELDHYYNPLIAGAVIETTFKCEVILPSTERYFINRAPYTYYNVTFQPFGKLELDSKYFVPDTPSLKATIYFRVKTDFLTGNALLYYGGDASCPVYLSQANVMYALPLSSQNYNASQLVSSAVSIGGGIASMIATQGASAPASIGAISGGVMSGVNSLANPNQNVIGGDTKIIDAFPVVEVSNTAITLDNDSLFGKLVCETLPLSQLHGYTEIAKIHLDGITATAEEKNELETILKSGVIF